ncbi:WYL domain-containing protein [Brevibacterium spongiae]|uniref:WYL domain-containing protein n=1 Tax=Brevibacterium spongiae TaxID=2909672 RepID=A0ABY5SLQ3_9MICO|nr:WYL domain-containing protein [Brevibacterium spongiae]
MSPRTVRSDIDALREIGYSIEGTRGSDGGYRLTPNGSTIPPLLLNTDEAVAVAVGLHSGLSCIIGGMEEISARALAKLESILPDAVRTRVHNLAHFTVPLAENQPVPIVEPALIVTLIDHCHRHERLRFTYRSEASEATGRVEDVHLEVEPYRLVNRLHRWYLLAYAPEVEEWRVFHAEHILPKSPSGPRFDPRPLPAEDIGDYVERRVPGSRWRHSAQAIVNAPAAEAAQSLAPAEATVEALADNRCLVTVGGQSIATMALCLARLDVDFTVVDNHELSEFLRRLSHRLERAASEEGISDSAVSAHSE